MAINFPNNRDQLNPALPTGALQNGDTTLIGNTLYTYVVDGSDSWWTARISDSFVNTAGDTMTGNLTVPSLNGGQLAGRRNQFINGAMEIWQRGIDGLTLSSGSVDYLADRWAVYKTSSQGLNDYQRTDIAPDGFNHSARLNSSQPGASIGLRQCIELERVGHAGKFATGTVWTFSCYALATNNQGDVHPAFRFANGLSDDGILVYNGSGDTQNLTDQWQRFSWTFTFPHDAPEATAACLRLVLNFGGEPDARVTGIQLEPGPVATPYEHRSLAEELSICKRFYQFGAYQQTNIPQGRLETIEFESETRIVPVVTVTPNATISPSAAGTEHYSGQPTANTRKSIAVWNQNTNSVVGCDWVADAEFY